MSNTLTDHKGNSKNFLDKSNIMNNTQNAIQNNMQ